MRQKRLDIEEALSEEKKTFDTLKKELESFQKKHKIIETAVKSAEGELEAFQVYFYSSNSLCTGTLLVVVY